MSQIFTRLKISAPSDTENIQSTGEDLIHSVSKYAQPDYQKAFWQISNTFVPYIGLWALMIFGILHGFPYWITLLLLWLQPVFWYVYLFFSTIAAMVLFSLLAGPIGYWDTLIFTPFVDWQRTHVIYHSASGNLDLCGVGDIWTLTVDEYLFASRLKRLAYQFFRNPLFLFTIIPLVLF